MFKSKKIGVDSIRARTAGAGHISPKQVSSSSKKTISVHSMHSGRRAGLRPVPEEYRTLDRGKKSGWGFLIFLFILFSVTVAGFYYWNNRPPGFQGDSVVMAVTGPDEIVSGDEVVYTIIYENRDFVALSKVELDVLWPDGFYFNEATVPPRSDTATTWVLGPIDPGQKKTVEIRGQLVGIKGQTQQAVFRLSYRPTNINSDFEVSETVGVLISDARINLELQSSEKVIAGSVVPFTATVSNLLTEPINDLVVEIIPPRDINVVGSEPALENSQWHGVLPPGEGMTFEVQGNVADDADGTQAWVVEISELVNEESRKLLRKEFIVTPVTPKFDIDLKINGQSSDFDIDYGETLNYQIKLTNRSTSVMNDIQLTALMDSDVIDRKTVQSNGKTDNRSIIWTKENIENLGALEPDEELIISWKANLLEAGTVGRATVDTLVTVELDGLAEWKQTSPVFVVLVGEGLVFNQGIYWELGGQVVGSGNLPPVTNERTEYFVVWSIDSGSQNYDTVTVSEFLPLKVTFIESDDVDEGSLQYDEDTNRLEWQINNFSTKLLPLKASFFVKLVPTDEDAGTVMTVMNPATVVASGDEIFQSKSFSLNTAQVIGFFEEDQDVGTVIE